MSKKLEEILNQTDNVEVTETIVGPNTLTEFLFKEGSVVKHVLNIEELRRELNIFVTVEEGKFTYNFRKTKTEELHDRLKSYMKPYLREVCGHIHIINEIDNRLLNLTPRAITEEAVKNGPWLVRNKNLIITDGRGYCEITFKRAKELLGINPEEKLVFNPEKLELIWESKYE